MSSYFTSKEADLHKPEQKVMLWGYYVVPRITKPLVIEENYGGKGPPDWKERIRFDKIEK